MNKKKDRVHCRVADVARFISYAHERGKLDAVETPDGAEKEALIKSRGNQNSPMWESYVRRKMQLRTTAVTGFFSIRKTARAMALANIVGKQAALDALEHVGATAMRRMEANKTTESWIYSARVLLGCNRRGRFGFR